MESPSSSPTSWGASTTKQKWWCASADWENLSPNASHTAITTPLTVGIDFTARDLQEQLRKNGQPWDLCKGFDGSAVIGQWVDKEKFLNINTLPFHLDINGHTVQEGCTADMLYTIDSLIAYISQYFTLKTGDILFTGTPVGVGPVHIDDHLEGYLADRKVLEFNCK